MVKLFVVATYTDMITHIIDASHDFTCVLYLWELTDSFQDSTKPLN